MNWMKTKLTVLGLASTLVVGCASMLIPTKYINENFKSTYIMAFQAEERIAQDAYRLEQNGNHYQVGQNNAAFLVGLATIAGVPGAALWGIKRKRPGDMSPEEQLEFAQEILDEFTDGDETENV